MNQSIDPAEFERRFLAGDTVCLLASILRRAENATFGLARQETPLHQAPASTIDVWYNRALRLVAVSEEQGCALSVTALDVVAEPKIG